MWTNKFSAQLIIIVCREANNHFISWLGEDFLLYFVCSFWPFWLCILSGDKKVGVCELFAVFQHFCSIFHYFRVCFNFQLFFSFSVHALIESIKFRATVCSFYWISLERFFSNKWLWNWIYLWEGTIEVTTGFCGNFRIDFWSIYFAISYHSNGLQQFFTRLSRRFLRITALFTPIHEKLPRKPCALHSALFYPHFSQSSPTIALPIKQTTYFIIFPLEYFRMFQIAWIQFLRLSVTLKSFSVEMSVDV